MAFAAHDDGVDDGTAPTGIRVADEQPVLLADRAGPDGILSQIIIDLQPAILEVASQWHPFIDAIFSGFAQGAFWQVLRKGPLQLRQEPVQNGLGFVQPQSFAFARSKSSLSRYGFHQIQFSELINNWWRMDRVVWLRLKELSPGMSPTANWDQILARFPDQ